mgnify:CR=1 FL=1
MPRIGEFVKVCLPGEAPWAECVVVYEDGTWQGRIDNHLFAELSAQDRVRVFASLPRRAHTERHIQN